MIFEVKNLGNLKEARIDLSKKLIVFTGQNNTGKTYLSYAIYGLLSQTSPNKFTNDLLDESQKTLLTIGKAKIDIIELANDVKFRVFSINEFKKNLPVYYGVKEDFFSKTEFSIFWPEEFLLNVNFNIPVYLSNNNVANIQKKKGEKIVDLSILDELEERSKVNFARLIVEALPKLLINGSRYSYKFFPIERVGVAVFSKDIYNSRFFLTNKITTFQNPDEIIKAVQDNINHYPSSINDAISTQENLSKFDNNILSDFADLALELEGKILGGELHTKEQGDVFLHINSIEISIQLAGSTVKSLSSLIFYLKYEAKINDTLIIDEPEINLHPDNQLIVARILTQLVNRGIRLIVSTHSDYILREFNHLLLMGSHKDDEITKELMERYGYKTEEVLNPDEVGAYIFHRNEDLTAQASEIVIDPIDGIQPDTINQVINQQNKISSALYNRLIAENV